MTAPDAIPHTKPLLTRDDLPLDAIAEICRRYGVLEMAVDPSQTRPPRNPSYLLEDDPFAAVDLYLIADFGPGPYDWGFKKHHSDVVEALGDLLGRRVWIDDKGILEKAR